jgi:pSer/pThr/pTyr-binding forkhead associated (FHA) protein
VRPGGRKGKTSARKGVLTITNGCFAGLEIPLRKQDTSLGRAVSCDICLDHSFVNEEHAIIRRSNGGYEIEDLNSRHGTSVNGAEIHRRRLKRGDMIVIGTFEIRFRC